MTANFASLASPQPASARLAARCRPRPDDKQALLRGAPLTNLARPRTRQRRRAVSSRPLLAPASSHLRRGRLPRARPVCSMASPPKPWETAGAPPPPPRPAALSAAAASYAPSRLGAYAPSYARFGSLGGIYGGLGPLYGGLYPGAAPHGQAPVDADSLAGRFNASTAATFQMLEGIVAAFAGFAQMLESTYMATHSSFFGTAPLPLSPLRRPG